MILESADHLFGGIASMNMRWHKLEGALVGGNGVLIRRADFIVQDVQGRHCATHCQPLVDFLIGGNSVSVVF